MLLRNSTRTASRVLARRAFTLMEILIVVAIIVVLAGIGGMYLFPRLDEAKEKIAKTQVKQTLTQACETFKLNNGDFPPNLEALTQAQPNGGVPILEADKIMDPWGQPYGYDASGSHNNGLKPDIWSNHGGKQIGNWPGSQ
jgi:general secretion pathway protein G